MSNNRDKDGFQNEYLKLIDEAGYPAAEEIKELVSEVRSKVKFPPSLRLMPLFTFISRALEQQVPADWLTDPKLLDRFLAMRQTLDFLNSRPLDQLIQFKDALGNPLPPSSVRDPGLLKSVAYTLVINMAHSGLTPNAERRAEALEAINRIEITLNGNRVAEFKVISKADVLQKTRTLVRGFLLDLDQHHGLLFETTDGEPYPHPVDLVATLDRLTELTMVELRSLPITHLHQIGHIHATMHHSQVQAVKLCPTDEFRRQLIQQLSRKR